MKNILFPKDIFENGKYPLYERHNANYLIYECNVGWPFKAENIFFCDKYNRKYPFCERQNWKRNFYEIHSRTYPVYVTHNGKCPFYKVENNLFANDIIGIILLRMT